MNTEIKAFYDEDTFTLTYVVFDNDTKDAVVIDPVLDFDPASGNYRYNSIDELEAYIVKNDLKVGYILETHAHADHLSGAQELKSRVGGKTAIGKNITKVQEVFKGVFNIKDLNANGEQFDELLDDEQVVKAGSVEIKVLFTPGHTPACASYLIKDNVFTGDALFMPDSGTGRCDFPAGSSDDLYNSVHNKLYNLPDDTKVFVGHDYQPNGRELKFQTTICKSKKENIQLKSGTKKEDFVKFRNDRDSQLAAPRLLLPSIQVNIKGGHLPTEEDNGMSYLKIPLKKGK